MIITEKDKKRFWSKVAIGGSDECWEWMAGVTNKGYGNFRLNKNNSQVKIGAHRVAYFLATGDNPGNMFVCHSCDNPLCCNPVHLWKGTQVENMRDMMEKGRAVHHYGIEHHNAKLTDEEVELIRELYVSKEYSTYKLAKKFGISQAHISNIVAGRSRKVKNR